MIEIELNVTETRVIGCLLEKETTTPDQYPLSLNALTNACNQKSNRDPVMDLQDGLVQECLDDLAKKRLVSEKSGYGSRVVKYQHRFCNTEFSPLQLSTQERAITCVLMLRGPQTPGELRTRTNRLCQFRDVHEVEAVLEGMIDRQGDAFVVRLPREAGRRESRYAQLFSGPVEVVAEEQAPVDRTVHRGAGSGEHGRLDRLEREVVELREQLQELRRLVAGHGGVQSTVDGES